MTDRPVRTRIAPSPTGDPHVGTAYIALFNTVFARQHGGAFLLRIEDTDQSRSTRASEQAILDALRWLGLSWDEGPDVGGPCGPYRQSERTAIYTEHVAQLLAAGHAYRCFATAAELADMRKEQMEKGLRVGYDRRYRDLDPATSARRAEAGEPYVVRMKVPTEGNCVFDDVLHGTITKDWDSIDDQVILKSDGFPTYHLANVVDDHLMGISHVIRGEEWLNSVPKHLQLYRAFGWEPPVFAHLPLLRNNDANKTKLSKRKNPTSINYYRRAGFLPQALLNFLGLCGWRPSDEAEKFGLDRMVAELDLSDLAGGGPVFDVDKLRWLNGRYLREDIDDAAYVKLLVDWAIHEGTLLSLAPFSRQRTETLADFMPLVQHFFRDDVHPDPALLLVKGWDAEKTAALFQFAVWELDGLRTWDADTLKSSFERLGSAFDLKLRDVTRPFYVAMSGSESSTPLFDTMVLLGSDLARMRVRRALELLGGVGKKRLKQLEKEFAETMGGAGDSADP